MAGINVVMLFKLKDEERAFVTGIAGLIGTVLAVLGVLSDVSAFFDWLGYLFLPVGGVMVGDYWILRQGKAENWGYCKGFNWVVDAAQAAITLAGLLTKKFSLMIPKELYAYGGDGAAIQQS